MKQIICSLLLMLVLIFASSFLYKIRPKLDDRAKKYIPKEKIDSFNDAQIESLNFFFQKSYIINESPELCKNCVEVDIYSFDVKKYDKRRDEKKRVKVFESKKGVPITLLSWEEVRTAYANIARKYRNQ